jgi:CRISPR-associated protein Csm5
MTSNPTVTRFFTTQALRLTPLTPIHIGCGIDFEPTNYVIDDGVLYHFDPAQVKLTEKDGKELAAASGARDHVEAILRVQRFFDDRRESYKLASHAQLPVSSGVERWYQDRVGRVVQVEDNGRAAVRNNLAIERCVHHPHTHDPYLPASSLKGSIRTAWLNHLAARHASLRAPERSPERGPRRDEGKDLERGLLGGQFETDPFRLLKLSDAQGSLARQVVLAVDRDKEPRYDPRTGQPREKDLFVRREVVLGGQYRALSCELRMDQLPQKDFFDFKGNLVAPQVQRRLPAFGELAQACNAFYQGRLKEDFEVLEQRRFCEEWLPGFQGLLRQLEPDMKSGKLMLLRVGRHSGAEAVTVADVRWISIKGRGRPPKNYWAAHPTTLWLAGQRMTDRSGLLPFGWLLVERADAPEIPALREWCDRQPKPDLAAIQAKLVAARAQAEAEAVRAAQEQANREAEKAEAARIVAEKEAARLQLTPNLQDVEALAEALRASIAALRGGKVKANTELHARARALAKRALAEGWSLAERKALADMVTEELPRAVQIDWKDERKKLQIAQLSA